LRPLWICPAGHNLTVEPGDKLAVLLSSSDYAWYNWSTRGYFYSKSLSGRNFAHQEQIIRTGGKLRAIEEKLEFWIQDMMVAPIPEPDRSVAFRAREFLALKRRTFCL